MSILVNATTEYLSTTLSTGPTESQNRLIACWVKWPTGEALGSTNTIFDLQDSGAVMYSRAFTSSVAAPSAISANGTTSTALSTGTIPNDLWKLIGLYAGANTGSSAGANAQHKLYYDGANASGSALGGSTVASRVLNTFRIGQQISVANRWRGYIAEVSIFTPASQAAADAIMVALATHTADTIASGTPIFYAPLYSDQTVDVGGVTLTVNGTPTWHTGAGDHPSVTDATTAPAATRPSMLLLGVG